MAGYDENQIFKELAARYAEHYGALLKDEAAVLNRQLSVTPRMDSNIRRYIKTNRTRRYAAGFAALAAAIAFMIMLPMLNNLNNSGVVSHESSAPAASTAPAPSQEAETPTAPEIIPISFTLPAHLTVTDAKLDNGKSVYYLANSRLDDIVMTMERNPQEDVFAGLKESTINDSTVYYKYTADYSVMAFQKRDVTYVLTCKYDANTLVPLAKAIL